MPPVINCSGSGGTGTIAGVSTTVICQSPSSDYECEAFRGTTPIRFQTVAKPAIYTDIDRGLRDQACADIIV
jgi:hypothetical protein